MHFLGNRNHISLDLETLATDGKPVILSIGAVKFNPKDPSQFDNREPDSYYTSVNLQSCMDLGMDIEGDTLEFWMQQPDNVRLEAFMGAVSIEQALQDFNIWSLEDMEPEPNNYGYLWGWSAAFDCTHLETAARLAKTALYFDFRHQLCGRTLAKVAFPEGIDYEAFSKGPYANHHALGDAIRQARIIQAAVQRLAV